MKKFTIEVSHASPQQLATIALELKIMSNAWEALAHGSGSMAKSSKLQASTRHKPSPKLQAASAIIWPCLDDIKFYVKERSRKNYRRTERTRQNA